MLLLRLRTVAVNTTYRSVECHWKPHLQRNHVPLDLNAFVFKICTPGMELATQRRCARSLSSRCSEPIEQKRSIGSREKLSTWNTMILFDAHSSSIMNCA